MPRIRTSLYAGVAGGAAAPLSALVWPKNQDQGGTSTAIRAEGTGAAYPGILCTVLLKVYSEQQNGYYTSFFLGRTDGSFVGDSTYWGCHEYPAAADGTGTGSTGAAHRWECSVDAQDYTGTGNPRVDDNGNATLVAAGAWYSQAAVATNPGGSDKRVQFWWDLAAGTNRKLTYNGAGTGAFADSAFTPGIIWGDAPWSVANERRYSRIRGMQVYQGNISDAHKFALWALEQNDQVLAYCAANSLTPFFLNMNPGAADVAGASLIDYSGNGHHCPWVGAGRPAVWTS